MGSVYKVRQMDADRIIALKLLHSINVNDDDSIKRFHREAKALALLRHDHIVNFLHFGFLDDGAPFAALEYLRGKDLSTVIKNEQLKVPRCIKILKQVLQALSFSHSEGVIHRDLKPANIILLDEPEADYVKLVDFGLAKLVTVSESEKLTASGLLIGSVHYMSPEQSRGLTIDARSDIYACGCILYEMLTGQRPFEADSPVGILYKQANEPAPEFSNTPNGSNCGQGLEAICRKAMEKNPDDRYQSAAEMLNDLELSELGHGPKLAAKRTVLSEANRSTLCVLLASFIALAAVFALLASLPSFQKKGKQQIDIPTAKQRRERDAEREVFRLNKALVASRKQLALAKTKEAEIEGYSRLVYQLAWLGRANADFGRYDDARVCLNEAYALSSKTGESAVTEKIRALILRGRCNLQDSRYPESDRDFQEAINLVRKEWGDGSRQMQDLVLHRLIWKAQQRQFKQITGDMESMRKIWYDDKSFNPRTAVGRYQTIAVGGPTRIDLLQETVQVLYNSQTTTPEDRAACLEALVASIRTLEVADPTLQRKWSKLTEAKFKDTPRDNPVVDKALTELESLPGTKAL